MDFGNLQFNQNHRHEAAARDAASGVRLLILAFLLSITTGVVMLIGQTSSPDNAIIPAVLFIFSVVSFVVGAYGTYLTADALNWSGFITGGIILSFLIPYFRVVAFIVLIVFSISLIRKAGYKFSLWGPLRKQGA